MNIGFIGLGNMGVPMAKNLAAAGHRVAGFDPAGTTAEGVSTAASAEAAALGADVVITMLPNGKIAQSVADQVLPVMGKGTVLLDCSTIDVAYGPPNCTPRRASGHQLSRRTRVWRRGRG
jgi:3-hydroxyisobutyrate dehydrogenase